jgi:peroxiredoxin
VVSAFIIILNKIQLVKKCLFLFSILAGLAAYSQTDTLAPAYLRFPTVPPFQILQVDSATMFSKSDLKKNQQLLLMYFSPDCEHCQHQTEDILHDIHSFKKVQIVMATYQPFEAMKSFYEKYNLEHYNIHVGRDTKFVLPPFYQIKNLPFLALYDKKGNLITTFEGNQKVNKILKAFGKEQ